MSNLSLSPQAQKRAILEALEAAHAVGNVKHARELAEMLNKLTQAGSKARTEELRSAGVPRGDIFGSEEYRYDAAMKAKRAAEKRLGQLQTGTEGDFDSSQLFGLKDFGTQFDMARTPTFGGKRQKFLEKFPEGEILPVPVNGSETLVAKRTQDQPYREFSALPKVAGALVSEPFIGSLLGAFTGGPIGGVLATIAGTTAGEVAQRRLERARGYEDPNVPLSADIGQGLAPGAVAGGLDFLTRGVSKIAGVPAPGRVTEEMQEAQIAGQRLGLPGLTTGQVSDSPFIRRMYLQVAAVANRVGQTISKQGEETLKRFRTLSASDVDALNEEALLKIATAQGRQLGSLNKGLAVGRPQSGEIVQEGLQIWKNSTERLAKKLYEKTSPLAAGVRLNLENARQIAASALRGVRGPGTSRRGYGDNSGAVQDGVRVSQEPVGEFKRALEDLADLENSFVKYEDNNAYEIVKNLRTRFFDFKQSDDPAIRRMATPVYQSLTKALDNPITESGKPLLSKGVPEGMEKARLTKFVELHKDARNLWNSYSQVRERSFVANALKTDTPEELAKKYFQPGNYTALAEIKRLVPSKNFETFKQGFVTDMVNAPSAAQSVARLNRFKAVDQEGLDLLLTKSEQRRLATTLNKQRQFEASPAAKVLKRAFTDSERGLQIIKNSTNQEIKNFIKAIGGPNTAEARALKAAVYKDIMDQSMGTTVEGVDILVPKMLVTNIRNYQKSGKLDGFFNKADFDRLQDFRKYSSPLTEMTDVGGGMMRGEMAQQAIRKAASPGEFIADILSPLYKMEFLAWVLSKPALSRTLPKKVYNPLMGTPAVLNVADNELNKWERQREKERLQQAIVQ